MNEFLISETDWLSDSTRLSVKGMCLEHFLGTSKRRARLFACACCRRVWHLIQSEAARRIVELAEVYADGGVPFEKLRALDDPMYFSDLQDRLYGEVQPRLSVLAFEATEAAMSLAQPTFDLVSAGSVAEETAKNPSEDFFPSPELRRRVPWGLASDVGESAKVGKFLRDIFGNPFRPVSFEPAWRTEDTVGIAYKMYDERDFSPMSILADALQDAGCEEKVILSHCRGPGPHVRGCWVVDLILGKE